MGDDHGAKLVKSLRGAAQKYVGVGFFLGFFLVLLTYFTLSEQFAIAAPNEEEAPLPEHEQVQEKPPPVDEEPHRETEEPNSETEEDPKPIDEASKIVTTAEESAPAKKPACDIQGPWASDVCDLAGGSGGVRIHGSTHTVLVPPTIESGGSNPNPQEWRVLPYSRKHMSGIKEITVRELPTAADAPRCAVTSQVPALVFAMGGLTGNYWHDFSDVMIPLYLQASRFDGEVQLVVTNIQPWYAGKYRHIIARLSRYDVVDMDKDDQVRCFPSAVVGIRMHKEFSIDPTKEPTGHSMPEFTKFLRNVFALPRAAPMRENTIIQYMREMVPSMDTRCNVADFPLIMDSEP
uniref:Uncharacterized protein n=1 Tax=Aegilops tauschii TaxID=37682 RepID=M8BMD1_AEGTA